ncbi:hypothetical protein KUTeg_010278 [Tegillarca granosa]|uniref:Uncharacterized protein n=1 Tax=Tegillarca granosa TaxID=220873 RepID=A0ABQ9F691_TEGGR|nr:hypothetical protein KUTeg_010278 [Tegillarca granosa]
MAIPIELMVYILLAGIHLEPHKKQLHITLAYQYQTDQHEKLLKLAKEINLLADVRWELRLYSRDSRMGQNEVRQVIKRYTPQLGDELELIDGDFIFMDPQEVSKSKDSWYQGTSWLTGCVGMFPGPYTRRTAETWTWALHRWATSAPHTTSYNGNLLQLDDEADNLECDSVLHDDKLYALVRKRRNSEAMVADRVLEPRKLYILRHGERLDFALGRDWFDKCFDDSGKYTRTNLNLPKKMLTRKSQFEFIKDPPLSEIGRHQCKITAFRMTCKLRIEPGLFEWTGHKGVPRWITPEDLSKQGYPVDLTYKPQIPNNKLNDEETVKELYSRTTQATKNILSLHEPEGGNILFVGHAGTLELCTRVLTGSTVRTEVQYLEILPKVPYCSMCMIEEDRKSKRWFFKDIPIHQFTHGRNTGQAIKDIL